MFALNAPPIKQGMMRTVVYPMGERGGRGTCSLERISNSLHEVEKHLLVKILKILNSCTISFY